GAFRVGVALDRDRELRSRQALRDLAERRLGLVPERRAVEVEEEIRADAQALLAARLHDLQAARARRLDGGRRGRRGPGRGRRRRAAAVAGGRKRLAPELEAEPSGLRTLHAEAEHLPAGRVDREAARRLRARLAAVDPVVVAHARAAVEELELDLLRRTVAAGVRHLRHEVARLDVHREVVARLAGRERAG